MRLRRLETLVVFIIGSSDSILPIYKISKLKISYFSNLFSKRINDFLIRFFYGDSGVMEAWKPVELQDRVQFPAIALFSIFLGHHHC
tara:strand:+ start:489 stop:749 length:261 start_codon:yes stop_codon:yes gene_type:complete